jgi:GDP-4-dehydro-6-deoxy-D-mannose reductase
LFELNVRGFERLRDALRVQARDRAVRMLVVGSAAEIGFVLPEALPVDESIACHPVTPYGRSKHALVQAALAEPPESGLEIVVARPFNLIGAGLSEQLAPGRFAASVRAVARGETDTIHCGWLDGRRDYLDIRDAVRAYRLLMEHAPAGTLANVCSGKSVRTGDILEKLVARAGVPARIVAERTPREGDIADIRGSHALLTSMTGWQPQFDVDESLASLLDNRA